MLRLRTRVDLGAMAIKGYSAFPKDCLVSYSGHLLGEYYPSAEMLSVNSAAPADWANFKVFGIYISYLVVYKTHEVTRRTFIWEDI